MKEIKISQNGTITLPKNLKERFKGSKAVLIESGQDVIVLKKTESLSLVEIAERLKAVGPKISKKEVEEEIAAYRRGE